MLSKQAFNFIFYFILVCSRKMHESAFWLSTNVLQSWLTCVASVPLTFPYVFRKFEVGNALSQKLEAGKGRSPASYGTLTTDKQYTLLLVIDDDTLCFCHWPRRAEALYSWAARLCVRALFCNQARSQGGWELNPPERFSGKWDWKVWDYIAGTNAPKCIISTPKPHELQSAAKRLMILSLFFYLYKAK